MLTHRPVHPGEIVQEQLEATSMSAAGLARALHVPANRISQMIAGKRAMTADTAMRLARFFRDESYILDGVAVELRSCAGRTARR